MLPVLIIPGRAILPYSLPLLGPGIAGPAHPKRFPLCLLPLLRHPFGVMHILPVTDITGTPFAKPANPFKVPDLNTGEETELHTPRFYGLR